MAMTYPTGHKPRNKNFDFIGISDKLSIAGSVS